MNYSEDRGAWYLLTGILIGAVLGIIYTRYFQPVTYVDTSPAALRQDFKDQYRSLIAAAYLANGDLVRANARLALLQDPDTFRALTEQAQQTLARDGSSTEARSLGLLAIALGQAAPGPGQAITQVLHLPTLTAALSTPGNLNNTDPENSALTAATQDIQGGTASPVSPVPTPIGVPETPLSAESFVMISKSEVCDQPLSAPLIQVEVSDRSGNPAPGVLVIVTWAGGEERFYTGLKPEKGLGYADFTLNPEFVYSLRLNENGSPLGNISAVNCTNNSGEPYWGAVFLRFGLQ